VSERARFADLQGPALRQGLAVGLATGAYGISCGALGVAAGLSVWQTVLTSLLLFSGGSQFAFFGVVGAGGSPVAAVATSTLLGVRNACRWSGCWTCRASCARWLRT
jgi:predicted branched-subunit amino acid permease